MTGPSLVSRRALLASAFAPASDRIQMGFIGVGGMGTGHVRAFLNYPDVRIMAVCDVRDANAQRAKQIVDQRYGDTACAAYRDFRELLARPDIDAIVMACPDHWHVLVGLEAARRGKHMYFEKPLSMSIGENKAMRDAVRRSGVVFQFGTQQRSSENYRRACELVRNGKIGQLKTIMVGSATAPRNRVHPVQPVPAGFDYEMWLGPAPWAPYCDERCTRNWTHISDYSLGCLSGAWGIHDIDIAQWALEADHTGPVETEGRGEFMRGGLYDTAEWWEVEHRYANGVTVIHMDMPNALKRAWQFRLQWMSMLFLGSEGWIHASRQNLTTHPAGLARLTIGPNEKRVIHSNDHRRNFLDAVRSGGGTISPIEAAVRSDSVCHHAHVALRLGRKLRWDPAREEFIDDPQANRMLARPMRAPWRI